jgi:hypothetical protein
VADAFCVVGVKSLKLVRAIREAGKHVIYFDKGYLRHRGPDRVWEYWRIAINDHHPTDYITKAKHRSRRWEFIAKQRAIRPETWRPEGGHIVFAGSSEKYHAFVGLKDPTSYAERVIAQLKKHTWEEAVEVPGAAYSPRAQSINDVLVGAHCLVTNGSNSSWDACLAGVPSLVLGQAIARPISSTSIEDIEKPYLATQEEKLQWFSNIAWCMFTEAEMEAGLAWKALRPQLLGEVFDDNDIDDVAIRGIRAKKADLKKMGLWNNKPWKKDRPKLSKEEQRRNKPFTKVKLADYWKAKESES